MLPQVLPKDKFRQFVGFLMQRSADGHPARVFAPMAKGQCFAFEPLETEADIARIRMDYDITILPPKKLFHPQHEDLLSFNGHAPGNVKYNIESTPTVLLGAHPYDLNGIATLDAAFAMTPSDPYYQARRAATKLIGLNIQGPYINQNQFMADMGTLEPPSGGFDLFLTDLGNRYFVEVGSTAGEGLVKGAACFAAAGPEDFRAKQEFDTKKAANFPKKLPYDTRYLPELLAESYDSLLWDALARRCFSCGTCTNVCPTCYCFDVRDELNPDATSGRRERVWDSCQLKSFAAVAGGENFRERKESRLRHRMFRKGKYILERTGRLGCVGCGRCVKHCVATISILEAFQQIASQTAAK
ncbi:MAG: 4Fe-4S dicluster domain-containing protein [Phycisphaerae bacterium]